MMPQLYKEAFSRNQGPENNIDPIAFEELTSCSISTKHLRTALVPSLNRLGASLLEFMREKDVGGWVFKELVQRGPFFQGGTQDLGTFLKNLSELVEADIKSHQNMATQATSKLKQAVIRTYKALNYTVVNAVLGESYPKFDSNS